MSRREALITAVEHDCNCFFMAEGKTFNMVVSHWAEEGDDKKKYRLVVNQLPQYRCPKYWCHLSSELKTWVIEKRYFSPEHHCEKHCFFYIIFSMNPATRELHSDENIFMSLSEDDFAEKRAEVGEKMAKLHVSILQREAEWDAAWRAMWDPRKDHVRRALFAFFKGESIDVRKRIYMMFRTCWLHDFTKPC